MRTLLARLCPLLCVSVLTGCGAGGDDGVDASVLRKNLSVDLAQVSSLLVVGPGSPSGVTPGPAAWSSIPLDPGSPGLVAISLTGELLEVSFLEPLGPGETLPEPRVRGIFPTSSWIIFSLFDFEVNVARPDGSLELVQCRTIAARRADGALFCAPLATMVEGDGAGDPLGGKAATANGSGDVVYTVGELPPSSPTSPRIVYRLMLGQDGGPTAEIAADPYLEPNRMLSNAAGDLFVNYTPSALQPTVTESRIVPLDQSSPFILQNRNNNVFVASGKTGDADQDTFYVKHAGNADGSLSIVTKTGSSFTESLYTPSLPNVESYGFFFALSDGIYSWSFNEKSLARMVADGAIVPNPTPILLTGVDQFISVGGAPTRFVPGMIVLFASTGSGYEFIRHDGVTQQDIPLEAGVEPSRFIVAQNGAIEFFGFRTATREQIHGMVAAGSTEIVITTAGSVDPAQVVVFTRIN